MIMETRSTRMKKNDFLKNVAEKKNYSEKVLSWLTKNNSYLLDNIEYKEYHKDIINLSNHHNTNNTKNSGSSNNNNNNKIQKKSVVENSSKIEEISDSSSVETARYILSNQKTKRKTKSKNTNIRTKIKQYNLNNDEDDEDMKSIHKLFKPAKVPKNNQVTNSKKSNQSETLESSKRSKIKVKKKRLKRPHKRSCDNNSSTISMKYNLATYKRNAI